MSAVLGILGFLGALAPILTALLSIFQRENDKQIGAQIEAGAVAQKSAAVQTAIAQAVVSAPSSQSAVVASLNAGTF